MENVKWDNSTSFEDISQYKSRSRSLSHICQKLGRKSRVIEIVLSDLIAHGSRLKVLEIGFGQGRALLELAWRFRRGEVTFYGVDKERIPPVEKREDLRAVSQHYQIVPKSEVIDFELPRIKFYDATRLRFADETLDLIYSAVTIQFIERKAQLLEEVCRVLKPGGIALLHIGASNWNYPYSATSDDKRLCPYVSGFVLKYKNELIPIPIYLEFLGSDAFHFEFARRGRCSLKITKRKSARLNAELNFNDDLSIPMQELQFVDNEGNIRDGFRSVYDLQPELYRALFEKGLLSKSELSTDIVGSESCQRSKW